MPKIKLRFAAGDPPLLEEVEFEHPLRLTKGSCIRARDFSLQNAQGTFQWSKAVRALTSFLLRGAASSHYVVDPKIARSNGNAQAHLILSGGPGTSASALAYAIEKQPQWLKDMFGLDSQNNTLLRHLVQRSNASQRGGKPVCLRWRKNFFDALEVQVFKGQEKIGQPAEWLKLAEHIDQIETRRKARSRTLDRLSTRDSDTDGWKTQLIERIAEEVVRSLHVSDTFTYATLQHRLHTILEQPELRQSLPNGLNLLSSIDCEVAKLGGKVYSKECELLIEQQLRRAEPLTIAMGAVPTANTLIYYYLQLKKKIPLKIDDKYLHTLNLVSKLGSRTAEAELPDLIAAGLPPVIPLLNSELSQEYAPLCLMPYHSVRSVRIGSKTNQKFVDLTPGVFAFSNAEVSSEALYFERLKNLDPKLKSEASVRNLPTTELFNFLCNLKDEARVLSFFPFYHLYDLALENVQFEKIAPAQTYFDSILLARRSLLNNQNRSRALAIAIRQAWLELSQDKGLVMQVLHELFSVPAYLQRFLAAAGLKEANFEAAK